ncbi:MAG: LysR family transcriptional regulator [Alphaproteobacteria bacterium]|nr:LysR family transcriptional regulator [Alphaproteobacteria bacterium]
MDKFSAHWDKLRTFYQVASIGTFSGAAEVLNTSQSALSRSIITLEKHIQARLFERSPRGLILTRQGEVLFEAVRKINSELMQAQVSLEEEENDPAGPIKISATSSFASLHLPLIMPEFLQLYPKIQLSIYGSDVTLNLHSNEVDVVIAPFMDSDDSLIQAYLMTFHLKLYASKEYLDKFGVPKNPSDLDRHQLLAYGDLQTPHPFGQANWHLTLGQKKGFVRQPHIMLNSAIGLFNFAVAGAGIVSLSEEHPFLNTSSLIEVLPSAESPTIDAYFIHSSRTRKIKRIGLLKDFLLSRLKNNLPNDTKRRKFIK